MFRPLSGTMNEHVLDLPVRLCGCWNTWCFRGISLKTVNMALQCTCHISVEHAQTLNRELEILPQTQAADSTTRQQQIRIVSGPSSSTFVCFSCCASYLPRAYLFAFLRIYENCLVKKNHPIWSTLDRCCGHGYTWRCWWPFRRFSTLRCTLHRCK